MKLSFHGAAQNVTGSCHLVEVGGHRILVDCGLFQGSRELDEENAIPFGFDESSIDFVLLTHAHLDHCGRLPLLVKRGFRGEIIATQATFELARLVILDSANLQEEEAAAAGFPSEATDHAAPNPPLYTVIDAMDCIARFGRAASYGHPSMFVRGFGRPSIMRAIFLVLPAFWSKSRVKWSAQRPLFRRHWQRRASFIASARSSRICRCRRDGNDLWRSNAPPVRRVVERIL